MGLLVARMLSLDFEPNAGSRTDHLKDHIVAALRLAAIYARGTRSRNLVPCVEPRSAGRTGGGDVDLVHEV